MPVIPVAQPVEVTGESSATISPTLPPVTSRKAETKAGTEKGSGSGSLEKGSGSGSDVRSPKSAACVPAGCPLPPLDLIQWEANAKGGWECWHAPEGANAPRRSKTYLGYLGKRKLAEWEALPDDQRRAVVEQWVSERRAEKGIS